MEVIQRSRRSHLVTVLTSDLLPEDMQASTRWIHMAVLQAVYVSDSNSRKAEAQVQPGLHSDVTGQDSAEVPPPSILAEATSILTRICFP